MVGRVPADRSAPPGSDQVREVRRVLWRIRSLDNIRRTVLPRTALATSGVSSSAGSGKVNSPLNGPYFGNRWRSVGRPRCPAFASALLVVDFRFALPRAVRG